MPKLPTDYSRIVIYCIKCKDDNIIEEYIGSTTDFINRKYTHKSSCNNENNKDYNFKIYQFIRANGGWNNWLMIELEKYPCNDGNEARKREEEIRVERKASLNSIKAFITEEHKKKYGKIYYEENKEQLKLQYKKWYEENREKRNEQRRIRYQQKLLYKDYKEYDKIDELTTSNQNT
jgi:hypothetical protein